MTERVFIFLAIVMILVASLTAVVMVSRQEAQRVMRVWLKCQLEYDCYGKDLEVHAGWVESEHGTMVEDCGCWNLTSQEFLPYKEMVR